MVAPQAVVAALWAVVAVAPGAPDQAIPAAAPAAAVRVAPQVADVLTPLWRRPVVRTGMQRKLPDSLSTPAISVRHQRVLVGTGEGLIYALRLKDGATVWRRHYRAPMVSEAALYELPPKEGERTGREVMVLGASDGVLLAIDVLTGDMLWKAVLDFEVTAAPTFAQGKLFVTSESNQVVALDAATGALLWAQSRPPRLGLTMQGHGRAIVVGEQVFCSFSDGFAMAMAVTTGQISWARHLSLRSGSFIDADATPVVADHHVFLASLTDGIYALTADGGETLWHYPATDVISLAHTGNVLFAADTKGLVYLLDPTTGQLRNRVRLKARPLGGLLDLGDAVALTAGPLGVVFLSPSTGKPLGSQALGGLPGGELAHSQGYVAHLTRSGHVMLWQHEADAAVNP